jgi:hypothetical protein
VNREGKFDRIVKGEVNPMVALLRGSMYVEGDPELLVLRVDAFGRGRVEVEQRPRRQRRAKAGRAV